LKNNLTIHGFGFFLRSVKVSDAKDIVDVRLVDKKRNKFIHSISPSIKKQEIWLRDYLTRDNDYYFIVKNALSNNTEGLIAIYNIDQSDDGNAELGRWVLYPNSLASIESIYLAYKFSFDQLNLSQVYTKTISKNTRVVSLHKSIGAEDDGLLAKHFEISGNKYDAIKQSMTKRNWLKIKPRLKFLSKNINTRL
tara:strand:- start:556 stop:1137 length:582 start_codon:yes stop_codon:yes gene_type:complete